ncbi:MAG TPA: response regulator [Elusimicrobiota bacterium]|jgi:two-component system KDP operon response regulator KdpE|nr:response regulator [Elusimicrobiota bacterium]
MTPPRKILIVDDSGVLRELLQDALSSNGYAVRGAPDGESGFAAFQDFKPDLVLLDRELPDAAGSDVFKRIRAHEPTAKVIVFTGHADADGERKYRSLGVAGFFSKSLGLAALLGAIKQALS